MNRTLMLALSLAALSGCVVYDTPCGDDGMWTDDGDQSGGQGGGQDDNGQDGVGDTGDDAQADLSLTMVPDTLTQGETAIVSLVADRDFDWSVVTDVQLYGDVTPCAMQARDDELLLTLSVDPTAALGGVDLVVETEDGDAIWAQDALFIVEAGTGDSSGSGAGDGSADGSGTGTDGSGSGTSSTSGCG